MSENRDESRERPSGSSSDSSTAASSAEIGRCGSDGGDGCSDGGGGGVASTLILPWSPLEGEELVNQESVFSEVIYQPFPNERIKGNLFITNFRFYFNSDLNETSYILDKPLGIINRVDKLYNNPNQMNEVTGILIYCKDGQKINIQKNENDANFEKLVYIHLVRYAFPLSHGLNFFAFSYRPKLPNNNGWNVYNPEKEYKRMGVEESSSWYISKVNNEYKLCDSYPRCLAVPQFVENTNLLEKIAQFRSRGRFPVLSWLSPAPAYVPILRSAQPQCGMFNRRSTEDESYLRFIAERCSSSNSSTITTGATTSGSLGVKYLYIYDARPFKNALANYTSGGGYENEKYYTWCKLVFLNIENIHAMRDSLGATNSEQFHVTTLENSKWLEHIRLILEGALTIVDKIESGHPVLVHCSDGWDRTAQLTSLSMLLLDKYYRTIEGFEVLIEKEWVSFGHKFGTRMGHGSDRHSDSDRSPIFIQFIDCVWQVMQDQPHVFEFNEKLLLTILQHIYTCQFGTFLMDSDYDREKYDLKSKTISLWSYVNNNLDEYVNQEYFEYNRPIRVAKEKCRLWTAYYFQHRRDDLNGTFNNSTNNNEHAASSINNGDLNASALDKTNPNNDSRNLEPFGTLLDNLFSNSYRLFSKILEKN